MHPEVTNCLFTFGVRRLAHSLIQRAVASAQLGVIRQRLALAYSLQYVGDQRSRGGILQYLVIVKMCHLEQREQLVEQSLQRAHQNLLHCLEEHHRWQAVTRGISF